jgi:hypothetical protein
MTKANRARAKKARTRGIEGNRSQIERESLYRGLHSHDLLAVWQGVEGVQDDRVVKSGRLSIECVTSFLEEIQDG